MSPHLNPLPSRGEEKATKTDWEQRSGGPPRPTGRAGWDGNIAKSAFLQTEPKFIPRMCFGVRELCKMEDGFGRRSEPKLKGVKKPGKAKRAVFQAKLKERSQVWTCYTAGTKPRSDRKSVG